MNGFSAREIFTNPSTVGCTYNDLTLLPGYIDFTIDDIDLTSKLTKKISLKTPIVSSPMDTVTQAEMAIALALQGGIGIIHANQTIEDQVHQVKKVKRFRNGLINDPIVLKPTDTVEKALEISKQYGYSGFPITTDGKMGSRLVGIVTKRDIDFIKEPSVELSIVMTPDSELIVATNCSLEKAYNTLKRCKKGRLPIVDEFFQLMGMICRKDLRSYEDYPLATINPITNQLLVGAAVSTAPGYQERVDKLYMAGVDVLVFDSSQGHSIYQINAIQWVKEQHPDIEIIAGNVVTPRQAYALIEAGADALRVGMSCGSICTTHETCGVGRAQAAAVYWTSTHSSIPCIADGGISNSGQMLKAFALGASTVMLGGLLAGTDESPGEYFYQENVRLKRYRGMGSLEAQEQGMASQARYFSKGQAVRVAQGVSGTVSGKGSVKHFVPLLIQGVKHGLQDIGCQSIRNLHQELRNHTPMFELRSIGAIGEGGVHDLHTFEK